MTEDLMIMDIRGWTDAEIKTYLCKTFNIIAPDSAMDDVATKALYWATQQPPTRQKQRAAASALLLLGAHNIGHPT